MEYDQFVSEVEKDCSFNQFLPSVRIFINQQLLKQEFSIKYLGVTLDSELNWKSHISFVENKIK